MVKVEETMFWSLQCCGAGGGGGESRKRSSGTAGVVSCELPVI